MQNAKVLVTGGAGFIGSHLVARLLHDGNSVTVYDNLSSGKSAFLAAFRENRRFRLIEADLLDLEALEPAIAGHDLVFHLSANPDARRGIADTSLDLKQETVATYNVLEAMRRNGVRKIVLSSSGTIYGETPVIPLPENYGPALPISLYGAGKLASEGLISAFCSTFDMQAWIFRFGNVVGVPATHGVIIDFINKLRKDPTRLEILGDGTQKKPYVHVEECVDGILFGLANAREKVNVFNIGPETATDVNTIARLVVAELGLKSVRFAYTGGDRGWPGDVPQVRYDGAKMKRLGWSPRLTSDEAAAKAVHEIVKETANA